jgi:lipopolysaccharide export system protein LptC
VVWTTRQGRLVGLFAVLAAASWWLLRSLTETPGTPPRPRAPDHTVWDLNAVETGAAGRPERRLVADQLRQYATEDLTELDQPRLTLYDRDGGPPWLARSVSGILRSRGEEVELRKRVRIDREPGPDNRSFALATEALRLWPKREYAQSDLPVRIASDQDWLTATGMRLWYAHPSRAEFPGRAHIFMAPQNTRSDPAPEAAK